MVKRFMGKEGESNFVKALERVKEVKKYLDGREMNTHDLTLYWGLMAEIEHMAEHVLLLKEMVEQGVVLDPNKTKNTYIHILEGAHL